ncbi:hypothetical protein LTR08_009042 [Meristemomyces frigidus]|nr:hypothetical protein LTR08_009042 [Meristemomyces frigidus]
MRFRAEIHNITTFTSLAASLATLGHITWLRLSAHDVRFTVIPETGSQVWSVLAPETLFDAYTIQSAAEHHTINLEVPLQALLRALKSARSAVSASVRLTKKEGVPLLSLTIVSAVCAGNGGGNGEAGGGGGFNAPSTAGNGTAFGTTTDTFPSEAGSADFFGPARPDRETVITQDIPVRVLAPASVQGLHEPRCREPDVHIVLPNLQQLKSISDRFTKLALASKSASRTGFAAANTNTHTNANANTAASGPKLELSANMHGCLRLSLATDPSRLTSLWTGLENPELDPAQAPDGIANHPSTKMRALGDASGQGEEGWATVRIEGRDWGRVLSVGRLGGRVIACFCAGEAVVVYVFLGGEGEEAGGGGESVLTYYISSFSA